MSYYHVWTTVCLNDKPTIFGNAARRADSRDKDSGSVFEEFRKDKEGKFIAVQAIARALKEVNAKNILLSYSSGGRATAENLYKAINEIGRVIRVEEIDYKRNVMANMKWTNEWLRDVEENNREFLFVIEKGG